MNEPEEEIALIPIVMSIVVRIMRHKYLFASIFILICAAAFAIALYSTPFYSTSAKMIYQTSKGSGSSGLSTLAALAGVSTPKDDPSAYLNDVIFSKRVMFPILERKWQLAGSGSPEADSVLLEEFWKVKLDTTVKNWELKKNYALLERLSNYISFAQDKKTSVITLSTEFEDPQVAYDVNLFLLQELNNVLVNKMNYKASENRRFIEERLAEVKEALAAAENVLKNYRLRNRLRAGDPADQLEEERLQRDVLINQEITIELQRQYEMAKIEEVKDLPVLDIIDPPMLPIEKSKPKRRKIVLIGGVAAFFFAAMISASLDLWQEKKKKLFEFYNEAKAGGEKYD
jgi:uncharacterized protein involved in exopolysaccharide biosynthesis